ncbi:MAG: hypothetical protein IT462_03855 [Planctomycetes bacterium]|nr:hypothetical protein [Planctomycetota bacterium]
MSNAKYRSHVPYPSGAMQTVTQAASQAMGDEVMQDLIGKAKRVMARFLDRAEQSLLKGDGQVAFKDMLVATRHVIAIARIEQRQRETAARDAREAAKAQRTPPAPETAPAPTLSQKAAAVSGATADNPTDPVIQLQAPPPDVRQAG